MIISQNKKINSENPAIQKWVAGLLWMILIVAYAKNYKRPEWDFIMIGNKPELQQSLNDFIYFMGIDIILLFWAFIAKKMFRNIISWVLMMLAIGKIVDEFIAPYGYHRAEQFYDCLIAALAFYMYWNRGFKIYFINKVHSVFKIKK